MSVSLNDRPNKVTVSGDSVTVTTGSGIQGAQGATGATGAGGTVAFFGNFFSTETQNNADVAAANTFTLNSTVDANGVSIVDGSKITFAAGSDGTFDLQFSAQFDKTDSGTDEVDIWISKNGTDLEWSNTVLSLVGNNAKAVPAWNFQLNDVVGGDYFEVHWWSPDSEMRVLAVAAGSDPTRPAVPSLILTVAQVTYTQAGPTGATGPQGPQGDPGPQGDQGIAVQGTAPANTTILWADTSEAGSMVVPAGGTTGQVLAKASNSDYDTEWANDAGIPVTIIDAAGDLIVGSAADTAARLAVGGTNGHVLTVDSAQTLGVKWAAVAAGATDPGYAKSATVNFYLIPGWTHVTRSTLAVGASVWYAPFIIAGTTFSIDRAYLNVTGTGTATIVRVGIYNADAANQPTSLVADLGTIGVTTTGEKTLTISPAVTVAAGRYLIAAAPDGTCTLATSIGAPGQSGFYSLNTGEILGSLRANGSNQSAGLPSTGVAWDTTTATSSGYVSPILFRRSA